MSYLTYPIDWIALFINNQKKRGNILAALQAEVTKPPELNPVCSRERLKMGYARVLHTTFVAR